MVVITVILSLVYYAGDFSFPSFASSYIGDNASISFTTSGGGGTASIVASERPLLIVGLGPDSRMGMNMPVQNGENEVINYYKDYTPTLKYTSTAITIINNQVAKNVRDIKKVQLTWYHPGETAFRTTGTHSGIWQNAMIYNMDSNTDPTGGAGVYRARLTELSNNGQIANWKSLVDAGSVDLSKRLWGYFGTLQSSGGRYSFQAADRIKKYMQLESVDFNNIQGWDAATSNKAAIAHVDLLMTLYSIVKDQVPDAAATYETAINEYLQNGTSPGQVTPTCNVVLYPGVVWEYSKTKQYYVSSIYDVWNYTYGVNASGYLGNENFKEIAQITGADKQDDIYEKLGTATRYMLTGLTAAGQQPNILGKGAFSYVTNYAFAHRLDFRSPWNTIDRSTSSRFMAESLYLNAAHKGLNVIIAPPSQFSTTSKFDADFSVIWAKDNSNHFVSTSDNVNDTVQFKINMNVPESEKASWKAIFDKYDKFQIAINVESNLGTEMRKGWSTASEGGQTAPVAGPNYFVNGQPYTVGNFVDIGKEELRRYIMNGNTYMGLTDIGPKNQTIQYAEMQRYAYNLTVSIKYGDGATSGTVTSSKTGWTLDKTDSEKKRHQVTVSRDGDPLSKVTYYSSPEAFAEFKEGTVSRTSNGSKENFEAMAGVPSTETMYFTSGGSEFILEMELELIQKESAWRDYNEVFWGTECEFKRNDQWRSSATAGAGNNNFGGSFGEGDNKFTAQFVADENGNDQLSGVTDQHMHMYKAEGAVSYTNAYNGHNASLPSAHEKDKNSFNASVQSQSNDSSSTTFTAVWTGTIENTTPSKGSSETYARGNYKQGNPAPDCQGGEDGYAGDFTESPGVSSWNVSKLNAAAKQAHDWAAKYEASNTGSGKSGNYEKYDGQGSASQGTASKLADSDGIERVWNIGTATIAVTITGGRSNQGGGSYFGGTYGTNNITQVETLQGNNANFGFGNSFSHGTDGVAGTHGDITEPGPPPTTIQHGADAPGVATVPSTVTAVGTLNYRIVVTFSNGTLSAHALCGPECQHDMQTIYDSWSQKYTYDYVRLNVARVYKIHRSHVGDVDDITLVNYNDAEDASQDAFKLNWMHGALKNKSGTLTSAQQSKKHNGTDTIVAAISQGDPNIFYNIANMQPEYYRTSGTNKEARRPAMAGRMRSTYQVNQMDYVYTEEMTRRGNISWCEAYNCTSGGRSNKCDGLGGTVDGNNPAQYRDAGHNTKWANGFLYNRGYQNYSGRVADEQYWFTDNYGNTGLCETKGAGTVKTGYTNDSVDAKDVLTEEYARLKYRRNSDNTMYIVSDMLILQTSSGDQPALYYQSPPQTQTLQKWYEYDQADRNAHAAKNVPARGTLFQNKMENIWNNNKNCAFNWGNNNIGQHGDVNVGGYTGEYQEPDNKFSSVSGGKYFSTIFDCTGGAKKLNDMDATIGHPLQWVDMKYGPGGTQYCANNDKEDYGANKVAFKKNYVGRNLSGGYETHTSSVVPGSVMYDTVNNVIDEVDPYKYKSTPNRCLKDNVVADPLNKSDDYNGQKRMSRVKGMRIFTDKILQDPTNENKEYITGDAYQDYIMILNWDKDDTFIHQFEPTDVYILDEDDKQTVDGYTLEAPYSREHEKINDIVVQNPVSVSDALLLHSNPDHDNYNDGYEWEEDFSKDSRTSNELLGATNLKKKLEELEVCSGDPDLCDFRVLNCAYDEDQVVANFDFEKQYTDSNGKIQTGAEVKNGVTYVKNTVNGATYKLPAGFEVYNQVAGQAYDQDGNAVGGNSYNPYTLDGQRYFDTDFGYTGVTDAGKIYKSYGSLFGTSYGNYLKAFGTRWSIPLADLIGGHTAGTKVAVEMNVYTPTDAGTMYVSFDNYAFGIDVDANGHRIGWNTGNGVSKYLKNTDFGDKSMRIKLVFDFGDASKSKIYINGQEATDYSLGKIDDVKDSIGDNLNIGWWSKDNNGQAKFYLDNLKIVRLAGSKEHNEDCYAEETVHSQAIQYTCQVAKNFEYNTESTGEAELFTVPQTGKYRIDAYGAQGGGRPELSQSSHGGYGGYSYGYRHFNKGDQVLVYAGGQGKESTGTREVYGWTLTSGCGNYDNFVKHAQSTVSGISYKNSVTGKEEQTNWTGPVIWSESCPTGYECGNHSVSIATVTATGELLSKVQGGEASKGDSWNYGYTGNVQTFTAPVDGTYQLEVWGAQGGGVFLENGATGGLGGYSSGTVSLTAGQKVYICVGSQNGYNGGGTGAATGGGATSITSNNRGILSSFNSNRGEVYIVAGGGGGAERTQGGTGGGTNGGNGSNYSNATTTAGGGSQTSGGNRGTNSSSPTDRCSAGTFGQGGSGLSSGDSGVGGGGGWFGGGGVNYAGGAGGGSGYTGGVSNGSMRNGVQSGNGKAKITLTTDSVAYRDSSSAGWNGGGYGGKDGFGGGGATDIRLLKYGGIYTVGNGLQTGTSITYGPYIEAGKGHYQADIYGTGLDKATYDVYTNKFGIRTYNISQIFVTPTHATLYFELTDDLQAGSQGLEVRVHGAKSKVTKEIISRLDDRIMIAGGGGGADNTYSSGETLGGADDGSGGSGGGTVAGNAYVGGKIVTDGKALTDKLQDTVSKLWDANKTWKAIKGVASSGCGRGAGSNYGYNLGYGESASYTTDTGGAGGGLYGGFVTNDNNGGAGGGSGYITGFSNSGCIAGTNKGNGRAVIQFVAHENNDSGSNKKLVGSYGYTGGVQTFTPIVSGEYYFEAWGASGGDGRMVNSNTLVANSGGAGGYAAGTKYLKAGQTVYINVGGRGGDAPTGPKSYGKGGYNGGGDGGTELSGEDYPENAAGGGGASDVRTGTGIGDRFIVAAGGGGAASHFEGSANNGVTGISGLVTKQEDGKTWARVLYQDISRNTNYFTTANMGNVNQTGLYSCLNQIEKFKNKDGQYEFMLEYPDDYPGVKNVWVQTQNPYDSKASQNGAGHKRDVEGFRSIRWDMTGTGGRGLEFNGGVCVLDGSTGFGNWWLCVGILNNSYGPTDTSGTTTKEFAVVPSGHVGEWNIQDTDTSDSRKWTLNNGELHVHTGYDLDESKSGDVYEIRIQGSNLDKLDLYVTSKESRDTGSWKRVAGNATVVDTTAAATKKNMRSWKVTSNTSDKCLAFCFDSLANGVTISRVDGKLTTSQAARYTMPADIGNNARPGASKVVLWARIDNVASNVVENANDPSRRGGAGGGERGRETNTLTKAGTQSTGYALGQGQNGFSCPADPTNRGAIGGAGGGYYGGQWTSAPNNSYAYGGAGGSSWVTGLAEKTTVDGDNNMPSYDGTGTMLGNRGNGHVNIYMKDTVSDGHHTDECTFIQSENNVHKHNESCIIGTGKNYVNDVLRQALNAEYNGNGTLLRQLLGETVYWKLKSEKTIYTMNSWYDYDRQGTTWTDCIKTFDGKGGFVLSDFGANPHFGFSVSNFKASAVPVIKLNADIEGNATTEAELYFITEQHQTWDTCVKAKYVNGQAVFNMYENPNWTGNVLALSFDPISDGVKGGTCHVRGIEFKGTGQVTSSPDKAVVMSSLENFSNDVAGRRGVVASPVSSGNTITFNNGNIMIGAGQYTNWEFRAPIKISNLAGLTAVRLTVQNNSGTTSMGVGIIGKTNECMVSGITPNTSNWQTVTIPVDGWTGNTDYMDFDVICGQGTTGSVAIRKIEFIGYGKTTTAGVVKYTDTQTREFNYTGNVQTFSAPFSTDYILEVYGASGGGILDDSKSSHGGKGGYSKGTISLNQNDNIYVYVGGEGTGAGAMGQGGGYNGGGQGGPGGYGGGGMTHISRVSTDRLTAGITPFSETRYRDELDPLGGGVIASDDDSGSGLSARLYIYLDANTTYLFSVGAYSSRRHGSYSWDISGPGFTTMSGTDNVQTGEWSNKTYDVNCVHKFTTAQAGRYTFNAYAGGGDPCIYVSKYATKKVAYQYNGYKIADSVRFDTGKLIIAAGGGGGADNSYDGAAVGSGDDGSGGSGGGTNGGNARICGSEHSGTGGTQSSGHPTRGVGESATVATDTGGGGGGYYGGKATNNYNGGAGGGSGYIGGVHNGSMKNGQRDHNGYAKITYNAPEWHPDEITSRNGSLLGIEVVPMLGLNGTEEGIQKAMNSIAVYANEIPDTLDNLPNPIFVCDRRYNAHVCDDRCEKFKVLKCTEPHHYGMHYASVAEAIEHGHSHKVAVPEKYWKYDKDGNVIESSKIKEIGCYEPCYNDANHKKVKNEITDKDGKTIQQQMYINTDEYFDIYFPNVGDFSEDPSLHGITTTTSTRGMGYEDRMDTSMWTREKYVRFSVDTLFYREETKKWEQYTAGEWVELPVKGHSYPYYHFYCTLNNSEQAAATVEYEVEAINAKDSNGKYNYKNYGYTRYDGTKMRYDIDFKFGKVNGTNHGMEDYIYTNYDCYKIGGKTASNHENNNDNTAAVTNKKRSATLRSKHGAHKMYYYDVVGRIGNMFITDTDDLRFSNLFKLPKADGSWLIDGIVREVYENIQNYYLSWHYNDSSLARDVRNRLVDRNHAMYNLWATQVWNGASDKVPSATKGHAIDLPLGSGASSDKNPGQLLGDLLKPGYNVNFEITSTGNYGSDESILQVKPYFYALAIADDKLPDGTNVAKGTLIPVDVHMKTDDGYKTVNYFGAVDNTETWNGTADKPGYKDKVYDYDLALKWNDEYPRRNYEPEEQKMTEMLRDEKADVDPETGKETKLPIVGGEYYSLGNVQILRADGHARSFIGTNRTLYEGTRFNGADDTNFDNKFNGIMYNYQAQRWHLKLGIPSSSVFTLYRNGKHLQAEDEITYGGNDIKAYELIKNSGKYVIVMTANIKSIGDTWILYYGQNVDKDRHLAENERQWFNGNITVDGITYHTNYLGSYDKNGNLIPSEFRVVLAVYDASDTSAVDYDIIGTH